MFTVAMSCVVIALEAHCVVEKEQKDEEENYHKCFEKVKNLTVWDKELIQVALNLEYLEAEFFLWSSVGKGLDKFAPYLAKGGPHPIGVQKANLPPLLADVFFQFGLQEVGHLRWREFLSFSHEIQKLLICIWMPFSVMPPLWWSYFLPEALINFLLHFATLCQWFHELCLFMNLFKDSVWFDGYVCSHVY